MLRYGHYNTTSKPMQARIWGVKPCAPHAWQHLQTILPCRSADVPSAAGPGFLFAPNRIPPISGYPTPLRTRTPTEVRGRRPRSRRIRFQPRFQVDQVVRGVGIQQLSEKERMLFSVSRLIPCSELFHDHLGFRSRQRPFRDSPTRPAHPNRRRPVR